MFYDGQCKHIKGEDIVVGDVVILEAGDVVPASSGLFEVQTSQSEIEESALTESFQPDTISCDSYDEVELETVK